MDFLIRKAEAQDYGGLCRVYTEVDLLHNQDLPEIFVYPEKISRSKEFITGILEDDNAAMFVAESNGKIIGFVHVYIRKTPDIPILVKRRYAYISEIAVTRELHGFGIGKALMKEAEKWAVQQNTSQAELNVWDFNRNAIDFYTKLGYSPSYHIMKKSI